MSAVGSRMLLVGLTGNIAAGKSSVARLFAARGATVVDADVLAREAVEPGSSALAAIVERWGPDVVASDGTLDRARLRAVVFEQADELEVLNTIVHPAVGRLRDAALAAARARGDRTVIYDVPLLFERDLADEVDVVVLVDAPREVRLERLVRDRQLRADEAMAMIAAQMPADLKRARSDFVIENASDRGTLAAQVETVWRALEARATAA